MKKFTLFLIFSLSSFLSFSQYIEGKVLDANTNKPIEGVNVYMEGINRGAITNEKGNYYLKFPYEIIKKDVIHFSHIAYKKLEIPFLQKKKNYSVNLLIDLKKLEEVKISKKRNLKQSISYKKLSSMKNGVHSFGSILIDNKIYVIGGDASYSNNEFRKALEYDPDRAFQKLLSGVIKNSNKDSYSGDIQTYNIKKDSWIKSKSKFNKRAYHNLNYDKNKIYVIGGKNISANGKFEYLDDKIEVFDADKDTIIVDNTNPHQAVNFASFTYNDIMILMGGSLKLKNNGFKEYSNKVHLYDIKTGNWYQLGNMPIAKEVKGVLIKDKIYLVGGFNNKPLSSIETFDLTTQKWKKFKGIGITSYALSF